MTAFRNLAERYEHLGSLGSGGMSTVYKARDKVLDRVVAIKQLLGELRSESMFLRFEREAKAYATLRHPNIVSVFDFGTDENNNPFLVMDFVEGETLDEVIADGAQPLERILEIFVQLLDGLSHAHHNSIVHRDLKPTNVMVQGAREERKKLAVKLMDFGIAKLQHDGPESGYLTQPGSVIGSPMYMSPEQGSALDVDARSDVYSVGCMLFEALLGSPPFRGDTAMMTIISHRTAELPQMVGLSKFGEAKGDLEAILRKALEKQPEQRFQSAAQMKQALIECHEKLRVHQVVNLEQSERQAQQRARTKKVLVYGGAVLAVVAIGVLAYVGETLIEKLSDASYQLNEQGKHKLSQVALINDERRDYWREGNNKEHLLPNGPSPITLIENPSQVVCISLGRALPLVARHDQPPTQREKDLLVGIDQLPSLTLVALCNFSLRQNEFKLLSGIRRLRSLTLSDCRVAPGCIELLRNSAELQKLNFRDCELDVLSEVSNLQGLTEILLPGLDLSKPGSLSAISQLKNLEILNLQDTNLSNEHLLDLVKLKKLVKLNLCGCPITEEGCKTLAQLESLEFLFLDYTKVPDEGLRYLAKLPNLRVLLLNITSVSDAGIMHLSKMPNLRQLEVDQSKCTPNGIARLKLKCPQLKVNRKGDPNEVQKQLYE